MCMCETAPFKRRVNIVPSDQINKYEKSRFSISPSKRFSNQTFLVWNRRKSIKHLLPMFDNLRLCMMSISIDMR